MKDEKFKPISFKSIYDFFQFNKLEARSHDGKYYNCILMRAIRAGLNRNLNFSTITDRVQVGK